MPSQMTSTAGGVASAPTVKPCGPLSKLPNMARPKKGKVSAKNNKAVDVSGSSKPSMAWVAVALTAWVAVALAAWEASVALDLPWAAWVPWLALELP